MMLWAITQTFSVGRIDMKKKVLNTILNVLSVIFGIGFVYAIVVSFLPASMPTYTAQEHIELWFAVIGLFGFPITMIIRLVQAIWEQR